MHFLHPAFLLGLSAAALPIVIHLVFRPRARVVLFPSVMLLRRMDRRIAGRRRLKELLLLALRILALALLALGLSGPVLPAFGGGRGARPVAAAIVLDDSYSMGFRETGGTVFDRGKELARAVLETLEPGDPAGLLTSAGEPRMTRDPAALRDSLADLSPSSGDGTLRPLVEAAVALLRETAAARRELYVISDFQERACDLDGVDLEGGGVGAILVPVAPAGRANAGVSDLAAVTPLASPSVPFRVRVRVVNHGPDAVTRALKIRVDGRAAWEGSVFVPARGSAEESADLRLEPPGWRGVAAEIEGDALPADDRRFLSVLARPATRVVVVRPDPGNAPSRSFYLEKALDPGGAAPTGVEVVPCLPANLAASDLGAVPAVFLVDAAPPDGAAARLLRAYVASGGGLVIAAGPDLDARAFNELLAKPEGESGPLSPVRLLRPAEGGGEAAPEVIRETDRLHPILAPMGKGMEAVDLGAAVFYRTTRMEAVDPARARVVARFASGAPALVEGGYGLGRVAVFASSFHLDATNLPLKVGWVPFVHGLLAFAAAGSDPAGVRVGEPLVLRLNVSGPPPVVRWDAGPSGTIEARAAVSRGTAAYEFGKTRSPGIVAAEWSVDGRSASRRFAVNVNPEEGRLDFLPADRASAGAAVARGREELTSLIARLRQGTSLARPLLLLAFALVLLEGVVAGGWRRREEKKT